MNAVKSRFLERPAPVRLRLSHLCVIALGVFLTVGILRHSSSSSTPESQSENGFFKDSLSSASLEKPEEKETTSISQLDPVESGLKPVWNGWAAIENMFIFGDSYTDNGFWAMGHQPNDTHPFGNWDRLPQGGIFTPRWPNFLATTHNQSYIRAWNYAWTGSTIDKKVVSAWALSQDFPTQVGLMLEAMSKPEMNFQPWTAENSLVAIFLGVNDVNLSADEEKKGPVDESMAAFKENMDKLYDAGARNFLILNTPPIDVIMQKHLDLVPSGLATYNTAFKELQSSYVHSKPDTTVFLFDTNRLMTEILNNPKDFPETNEIDDVGLFLPTCMSCEFAPPNTNLTDVLCEPTSRKHFWCEWMHIGFPVQNATAANIVKGCFSSGQRTGYCS